MKEIEKHTLNGWVLMSKWELPVPRVAALLHHRFYDGTGYPTAYLDGRPTPSGKNIHVFARILNIVDIYDALITNRPYREAFHPISALWIMKEMYQQNKFDPDIFRIFYKAIKPFQVGEEVLLSNGLRALIYGHNKNYRLRPKVVAIIDEHGNRISAKEINNYKINLEDNQYQDVYIKKHLGKDVTEFTGKGEKDLLLENNIQT
jgi:HD-GYP domain-containing protein (c-di-GMP phosphodiesterase class II)